MNPAVISRRAKSAQVMLTGAAAALTFATVLAGGAGAATAPHGARAARGSVRAERTGSPGQSMVK